VKRATPAVARLLVDRLQQLPALARGTIQKVILLTVGDGNPDPGRGIINGEAVTDWDGPADTNLELFKPTGISDAGTGTGLLRRSLLL
jgi:hypothetical protein